MISFLREGFVFALDVKMISRYVVSDTIVLTMILVFLGANSYALTTNYEVEGADTVAFTKFWPLQCK